MPQWVTSFNINQCSSDSAAAAQRCSPGLEAVRVPGCVLPSRELLLTGRNTLQTEGQHWLPPAYPAPRAKGDRRTLSTQGEGKLK